ncbi:AraC family transcriptional regulator [Synechococcus sp. RSCCF101]|uniref:AraC family transcriptional regulator n=1 Tax=Synechococcus sp. RSCCF101 TaxID=2511069 RepID=UPI0012442AD4|nr:AraC family transcriptional regulator [Synechococcus sp. RSCCF101]QEY32498.1 AraC family transcriptional regulator [Synechococcus sp. RSCCF101]
MDAFGGLLDGPRARGAFSLRTVMTPPWSLRILAESPITVVAMVRGHAWVIPDDGEPIRLGVGDVAVTRAPDHYTVADDPGTVPDIVIHPGQRCSDLNGNSLEEQLMHGVRTWGNDPNGSTLMLVGAYESTSDISDRLLRALPPVLSLANDTWNSPLVALLCEEMAQEGPGQAAVLDRLIDLLLIAILRAWFTRPEADAPKWYRAKSDPLVSQALQAMHADPAFPWTLATLAKELGASRAALSRRFQDVVGESPMKFLTSWRLALAADMLCEPEATVGTVAHALGYSTPFALSTAFKRVRGISPQEHRARAMPTG